MKKSAVLDAIEEFDSLGRDAFLEKYGFGQASKYFVRLKEKWYDSKAIVGAAHKHQHGTAIRRADFNGGEITAVARLQSLGFTVTATGSQPDWVVDELMLALKLYLDSRDGNGGYNKKPTDMKRLSQELRILPIFSPEIRINPGFRTPGAVSLKMENFASLDPDVNSKGKNHIGAADRAVWNEWGKQIDDLNDSVSRIRHLARSAEVANETGEEEEFSAIEGRMLYREHRRYERNQNLVKKKKNQALNKFGRLACEVCGFDSEAIFDIKGVIEVHHVMPLHQVGESRTRLGDLALLCPTCHRTAHKHRPFLTPQELIERMKDA